MPVPVTVSFLCPRCPNLYWPNAPALAMHHTLKHRRRGRKRRIGEDEDEDQFQFWPVFTREGRKI